MSKRRSSATPVRFASKNDNHGLLIWSVVFLFCGVGLILAAAFFVRAGVGPVLGSPSPVVLRSGTPSLGFTLGQGDAPLTIDIYEDFQCPVCRDWSQIIYPQLRDHEIAAGKVKLVFHGFAFIGPESAAAERAAYAAANQGRFWDMWATLYANQGTENSGAFSDARLRTMADKLGLNLAKYDVDFASSAAADWVSAGIADAAGHNVTATPTVVIAGQAYSGVGTYSGLQAAITAALAIP